MGNCIKAEDTSLMANSNQKQTKQVDQRDITVLKLKTVQDRLLAQKKNLQKNSDKAQEEAKQHVANKNKERAMLRLRGRSFRYIPC